MLLSAGIVMIPYILITGGFDFGHIGTGNVLLLLVLGIVHTGIAYALYFGSMDGMKMQTVAVLSYIDPVSALVFSALLLGERMSFLSMAGAVMILGAAFISETKD